MDFRNECTPLLTTYNSRRHRAFSSTRLPIRSEHLFLSYGLLYRKLTYLRAYAYEKCAKLTEPFRFFQVGGGARFSGKFGVS